MPDRIKSAHLPNFPNLSRMTGGGLPIRTACQKASVMPIGIMIHAVGSNMLLRFIGYLFRLFGGSRCRMLEISSRSIGWMARPSGAGRAAGCSSIGGGLGRTPPAAASAWTT